MDTDDKFVVDDDVKAAWVMRRAREANRKLEEIDKVAAAEVESIVEWAQKQRESVERDYGHWETLLINYAERERTERDRKSIDLPTGKVTSRLTTESWKPTDDFVTWAKEFAPNLVRQKITELPETNEVLKEHLELSEGKVVVKETGEVVEGIEIKNPTVNYKVEVKE
jgi:hypothetical protein